MYIQIYLCPKNWLNIFMNDYICQQIFKYILVSKLLLHTESKLKDQAYLFYKREAVNAILNT